MIRTMHARETHKARGADDGFGALETSRGCLPLEALDVDARIGGLTALTSVAQTFRNVFAEPLEATYVFPLPPSAAVIGFRMAVDGAVIEGRIDERGRAREDYQAALEQGRSAAIAEEDRPDVFTLRVGNIPPRALARVEFTLVVPLAVDSLEATYRFPLVVAPRYCPGVPLDGEPVGDGVAADTDRVPDASRISPPVLLPGFASPVRLGIRVALDREVAASADLAASLPLHCDAGDGLLHLAVKPGQRLDRDFVLRWPLPAGDAPRARFDVERDDVRPVGLGRPAGSAEAPGDGSFTCVVLPPAVDAAARPPRDVVFVLDRSGSMGGWKIVAAKRAVTRSLDTLSPADRVAVIAFDDSLEHPGDTCRLEQADHRRRFAIGSWLDGIEARGGTEMEGALARGLALLSRRRRRANPARSEEQAPRDPILVLLTDGQIGDEEAVLRRLGRSLGRTTLHVIGIDTAINEGLVTRLVDASGGSAECVESAERLEAVMDRIQERLVAPLVTDVTVEGEGIEILADTLPASRPSLYPGVPLVLRGRCRGAGGRVTLRGRHRDGSPWTTEAEVQPATAAGVGTLWARARLRHLEDTLAIGSEGVDHEALERRIVELSTAFGVLCRFTALVAIDPRLPESAPEPESLRRVVQPVSAPAGWQYHRHMLLSPAASAMPAPAENSVLADMSIDLFPGDTFLWPSGDDLDLVPGPASVSADDSTIERVEQASPAGLPEALRRMIREALALAAPRSGRIADVPAAMVALFVAEVRKVLQALGAEGVAGVPLLPGLLAALERDPADRDALSALLEALADAADPAERWWRPAPAAHAGP